MLGIHEFATDADVPIPAGHHQVRMEFAYDGGGLAKGGDVTLFHDGTRGRHAVGSRPPSRWSSRPTRPPTSATSRAPRSPPTTPSARSRFTGKIHWVQLDVGVDDNDHFIDPEERLRIAMARQ